MAARAWADASSLSLAPASPAQRMRSPRRRLGGPGRRAGAPPRAGRTGGTAACRCSSPGGWRVNGVIPERVGRLECAGCGASLAPVRGRGRRGESEGGRHRLGLSGQGRGGGRRCGGRRCSRGRGGRHGEAPVGCARGMQVSCARSRRARLGGCSAAGGCCAGDEDRGRARRRGAERRLRLASGQPDALAFPVLFSGVPLGTHLGSATSARPSRDEVDAGSASVLGERVASAVQPASRPSSQPPHDKRGLMVTK